MWKVFVAVLGGLGMTLGDAAIETGFLSPMRMKESQHSRGQGDKTGVVTITGT